MVVTGSDGFATDGNGNVAGIIGWVDTGAGATVGNDTDAASAEETGTGVTVGDGAGGEDTAGNGSPGVITAWDCTGEEGTCEVGTGAGATSEDVPMIEATGDDNIDGTGATGTTDCGNTDGEVSPAGEITDSANTAGATGTRDGVAG